LKTIIGLGKIPEDKNYDESSDRKYSSELTQQKLNALGNRTSQLTNRSSMSEKSVATNKSGFFFLLIVFIFTFIVISMIKKINILITYCKYKFYYFCLCIYKI
jgi:hypothetical protein